MFATSFPGSLFVDSVRQYRIRYIEVDSYLSSSLLINFTSCIPTVLKVEDAYCLDLSVSANVDISTLSFSSIYFVPWVNLSHSTSSHDSLRTTGTITLDQVDVLLRRSVTPSVSSHWKGHVFPTNSTNIVSNFTFILVATFSAVGE